MKPITPEWLKARLPNRAQQARLAEFVGLTPDKMSKSVAGTRALSVAETIRVYQYFGLPTGLSDGTAAPFTPKPHSLPAQAVAASRARLGHPALFRLSGDAPDLGHFTGDLLLVDLKARAAAGDLVLATVAEATGDSRTLLLRYLPPHLVFSVRAGESYDERANDPSVAINAVVAGCLRGVLASE